MRFNGKVSSLELISQLNRKMRLGEFKRLEKLQNLSFVQHEIQL